MINQNINLIKANIFLRDIAICSFICNKRLFTADKYNELKNLTMESSSNQEKTNTAHKDMTEVKVRQESQCVHVRTVRTNIEISIF